MAADMIDQPTPGLTHGNACAYCGLLAGSGGRLVALRPSVRAAIRFELHAHLDISDRALPALRMARCDPPCHTAERAYHEGFRD
jgi:hypothetical protein